MNDLTPEHTSRRIDRELHPEVSAAYKYVDSVVLTADAQSPIGGHAWHGWALREAFLAGCTHAHPTTTRAMTNPYRAMCAELVAAWDDLPWEYDFKGNVTGIHGDLYDDSAADRARALLDQPVAEGPTDEELLKTYSEAYAADIEEQYRIFGLVSSIDPDRAMAVGLHAVLACWGNSQEILDSSPQPVAEEPSNEELIKMWATTSYIDEPGGGLALARAVLARYGRPTPQPVAVSERPWEREGWCDEQGRCWLGDPGGGEFIPSWRLCRPEDAPRMKVSLPAKALPTPEATND